MKHAEHCGLACTPTLNQTGRIEGHFLLDEQVGEFVAENILGFGRGEIAALFAPAHDGIHDAADQLAHRSFALGGVGLAVEILGSHDVGGRHGPGLGDFHVFLAENYLALVIAD